MTTLDELQLEHLRKERAAWEIRLAEIDAAVAREREQRRILQAQVRQCTRM